MNATTYFAALPPDELARELVGRIDEYKQWCLVTGRLGRWRMAFDTYYGQRNQHSSQYVTAGGEQGELSMLMSNEYRSILQQIIVYTTKNKPSIDCATANTDSESQQQAIGGKQILEYYGKELNIEAKTKHALEISLIMDSAWLYTEWDVTAGSSKMMDPDTGRPVQKGKPTCSVKNPLDSIVDYTNDDALSRDWQIKGDLVNKFDLAAQYPEMADDIISMGRDRGKDSIYQFGDEGMYFQGMNNSPLIKRWSFYHKDTPALPGGRFFQFLDAKVVLTKNFMPFQYEELPGTRVCPTEMIGSVMGYSNTNDLLALQDVMDALMSSGVTNMTTFGLNNLWTKPNSNLDFQKVSDGMNHIETEDKPEILTLNKLPPEWFNLANFVIQRMESISGINSIARGNTAGKDYSGAAMALLQSMAIEFNSGMQMSYNNTLEEIFNNLLSNLQKYGDEEEEALILGSNKKYMIKKFSSKDLNKIKHVFVQQSNPFKDTTAGKMTMVDYLMKFPNCIKYPDQISQVLTTGSLDVVLEPQQKQNICIQDENERLSRGESVKAVWTENHPAHLSEHLPVTWDPDTKVNNPQALLATDDHIKQHLMLWQSLTPDKLAVLGIPPYPMPMMPPPATPGGGAPQGIAPPPTEASGGPPMTPAQQPEMPTNPLSGQKFNNANGGLQ